MWVGTENGLAFYENGKWKVYRPQDGLAHRAELRIVDEPRITFSRSDVGHLSIAKEATAVARVVAVLGLAVVLTAPAGVAMNKSVSVARTGKARRITSDHPYSPEGSGKVRAGRVDVNR